jgi:uncharacterized protein
MMEPLSDKEVDELDAFLLSDATSDETMTLDMLDGYLTAIAIGPTTLVPSQWLPGIWGPGDEHAPEFETMAQAQRILELIMRHLNGIVGTLEHDPNAFEPFFDIRIGPDDAREYLDGEMWAYGFMKGFALCRQDWQPLFDDVQGREALRPLRLLGAADVTPDDEQLVRTPQQREELSKAIPASIAAIYRFWLPHREAVHQREIGATTKRSEPKIGRNDPCPCGSGKKFKKCCGEATPLH